MGENIVFGRNGKLRMQFDPLIPGIREQLRRQGIDCYKLQVKKWEHLAYYIYCLGAAEILTASEVTGCRMRILNNILQCLEEENTTHG